MHILRIEHQVPDYDAWKEAFDSDPIGRERSGVRRYHILRATDDPNYVMSTSSSTVQVRLRPFMPRCATCGVAST